MIVVEPPTEALPTDYLACLASNCPRWLNKLIAKTLMIPLGMIMRQIYQFAISVVDQLSLAHQEPIEGIGQLAGTLLHEDVGGMWGDPCYMDATSGEFHHHEHVVCHQTVPRGDLHREEVRRGEDLPVPLQELCPAHARLAALRRGLQVVTAQDFRTVIASM
jgi:hypothetical protein